MPVFSPPTVNSVPAVLDDTRGVQRRLFRYYGPNPRGMSVLLRDGHYVSVVNPYQGELDLLVDGITYFLGGHVYVVDDAIANLLALDGYDVSGYTPPVAENPGFGEGGYGEGQFGA